MELTFLRISCILLIVACLILAVDKSATGYKLQNVASRIAEKTEIIEENEKRFKNELAAVQAVSAEKERRLYLLAPEDYSDKTKLQSRQQKLVARSAEAKQTKQLVRKIQTTDPAQLIREVTAQDPDKLDSVAEDCMIHPETGLITYPPAAMLETVARKNGMLPKTSFVWDLKKFRVGCVTNVNPSPKLTNRLAAVHEWTKPVSLHVIQSSDGSAVFPFTATDTHTKREIKFLPEKAGVPLGGVYVHYFRLTGKQAFQLDYELPAAIADEDSRAGIKLFPLMCGVVTTVRHNRMQSFRLFPKNGEMTFLVVAERAFFPVSVTGMTIHRETPAGAAAPSNAQSRPAQSAK